MLSEMGDRLSGGVQHRGPVFHWETAESTVDTGLRIDREGSFRFLPDFETAHDDYGDGASSAVSRR